jgi:hypothetical protein
MPPLTSNNPFACLSVELIKTDDTSETIVITPLKVNPPTLKHWECRLPKKYVISAIPSVNSLDLKVEIETLDSGILIGTNGLVDSGAEGMFLNSTWVQANNINTKKLCTPIPVYNIDGTPNESGAISEVAYVTLRYNEHSKRVLLPEHNWVANK